MPGLWHHREPDPRQGVSQRRGSAGRPAGAPAPLPLAGAAELGVDVNDVQEIVDLLRRLGLVLGAHELTPSTLPEGDRRRLRVEAAAIALRQRSRNPTLTPAEILRRRSDACVLV